jgi:nucleotide-binding universal stress UspA family protein
MYRNIVVGTDGSDGAAIALDAAIELARLTGATLHVVTAHSAAGNYPFVMAPEMGVPTVDITAMNDAIETEAQRIVGDALSRASAVGVTTQSHVVVGDPAESLLEVNESVSSDLLVVGNRGMTGVRRFVLGSVPNRLSHHCTSSLLIVDTSAARS